MVFRSGTLVNRGFRHYTDVSGKLTEPASLLPYSSPQEILSLKINFSAHILRNTV